MGFAAELKGTGALLLSVQNFCRTVEGVKHFKRSGKLLVQYGLTESLD